MEVKKRVWQYNRRVCACGRGEGLGGELKERERRESGTRESVRECGRVGGGGNEKGGEVWSRELP